MSEQEVRDGLRAAVSGEPPLSFDPDALMTKAQQKIKGRRALIAAGAATVGVAVAAVAVPTMLGTPRGSTAGDPGGAGQPCVPPTASVTPTAISLDKAASGLIRLEVAGRETTLSVPTSVTAFRVHSTESGEIWVYSDSGDLVAKVAGPANANGEPCPSGTPEPSPTSPPSASQGPNNSDFAWPPPNVKPVKYTADELNKRGAEMQAHLRSQFGKVVPDAKSIKPGAFQGEAAGDVDDGQGYLNAFTTFLMSGAKYAVDVYVAAPGTEAMPPSQECPPEIADKCQLTKQQDGSWVLIKPEAADPANNGMQILSVIHYRNTGAVVRVTGYNYDPTGQERPTYAPSIPVTVEQLTALATDPALLL